MNTKIICLLPLIIVLCFTLTAFACPPPPPPQCPPGWSGTYPYCVPPPDDGMPADNENPNNNSKPETSAPDTEPVTVTGKFTYSAHDMVIKGRMMDVVIERNYRSDANNGIGSVWFGYGWDMSYHIKVRSFGDANTLVFFDGQNRPMIYQLLAGSNPATYLPPKGRYGRIVKDPNGIYTLTEKEGKKYKFDPNGNITAIKDRNNNAITFICDSNGRPTTITDDVGRNIVLGYDSRWRLHTITDFNNRTWTYSYDSVHNLTSVTTPSTDEDPNGLTTTYGYDNKHNLTTVTDTNGQMWLVNSYDDANRVYNQTYGTGTSYLEFHPDANYTKTTSRNGYNTNSVYNSAGLATSETVYTDGLRAGDPTSYITRYEYDANSQMTKKILPGGNYITYTYDANGNTTCIAQEPNNSEPNIVTQFTYESTYNQVKTATDPCGNVITFDYNSTTGNLEKITYPSVAIPGGNAQPIVQFTYNMYGQVETITAPNNLVTKFEYYGTDVNNGKGKLWKVRIDPNGLDITTTYEYDNRDNITKITDANGTATTFAYNNLGQLTSTTSPYNKATVFKYNPNKMLKELRRPIVDTNQVIQYSYNILDSVCAITNPLGYVTRYSFNKENDVNDVNDAEGNRTGRTYDERGLLWKVTDANGGVTEYSYTLNGRLANIKDANGQETAYSYDKFDRLTKITYPANSTEEFTYDKRSNVTSFKNRGGAVISYEYDVLNRLVTKTRPNEPNTVFRYDIAGRLYDVNDHRDVSEGGGWTRFTYDRVGRVTQVTSPQAQVTSYEYNSNGLRTKLIYPDDSEVTYVYDALGRVTEIKYCRSIYNSNGSMVAQYSYDELSRRTLLTLGNDANAVYEYDLANRLKKLTNHIDDTNSITFDYANYDKVGNRKGCKIDNNPAYVFSYDKLYQLTFVDYNDGNSTDYWYDKLGNRTSVDGTAYLRNCLNQYTSVSSVAYSYDLNGNLTNDGTYKYYYDCENRLKDVNNASTNAHIAHYAYDYVGRRTSKTTYSGGTVTTKFCYDGDRIIAEYNGSTLLRKYVYGPGIDEPICWIADEPICWNASGNIYYYHYDGLGNVVALSSSISINRFTSISEKFWHSLGVKLDGSVAGWGEDYGYGETAPPDGNDFIAVAAGVWYSLALKSDGSIVGWGDNTYGKATPPAGNDFVAIAAGFDHSLALKSDGSIVGWGHNNYGQTTPPEGNDFVAIEAGDYFSLALKRDGSIVAWGDVGGEWGMELPPDGNDFKAIAAGAVFCYALALKTNGSIVSWGDTWGQTTPPEGNDFVAIAVGANHSLALKNDGSIVCWGYNGDGQATPPEGNNFIAVTAGGDCSLALKSDGSVVGWGYEGLSYYGYTTLPVKAKIVERYSYDVFGKATIRNEQGTIIEQSSVGNSRMFTGREYDAESGLYYYRARYYRPSIGRFLQTDPIPALNLYTYCRNNPLNWIDPWGLTVKFCGNSSERAQMANSIEELKKKSDTAKKLIEKLEQSKKVYKMKLTTGGNLYNWANDTIEYNPNTQSIGPLPWQQRPPEVGLAHELVHANHDIHDGLGNFVKLNSSLEEENRTVGIGTYSKEIYTENAVRREYGLPDRPKY